MKERLDILLVERGLAISREKAKRYIMAGEVFVDGQREDKPGTKVAASAEIELRGDPLSYVSRGGLKLEKALQVFPIDLNGKVCMDIGASTGGFTDCMLQNGAAKVYAIDVGYGQLDYRLRKDERVVCMERTNFRYFSEDSLPERVDFASCDVSFISLEKMLPAAYELLTDNGEMVCLIKPQFEAGREKVGKKGVVREPKVHIEVVEKVMGFAIGKSLQDVAVPNVAEISPKEKSDLDEASTVASGEDVGQQRFYISGLSFSSIRGPEGNIEYLLYLTKYKTANPIPNAKQIVEEAHAYFSDHSQQS